MRRARCAAATKSDLVRSISALVIALGRCQSGANGSAEGASVCHAPSPGFKGLPPSAGGSVEPLRPACPSCSPCAAMPYCLQKSMTRFAAASLSSEYMPAHFSVIRPSGLTCVASVITRAPAPSENEPRCIRCQSPAEPLSELYWHIGETAMRFLSVRPRSVIGEKSALAIKSLSLGPTVELVLANATIGKSGKMKS